jgi:Fe-S oxidoreductase
MLEIAQAVEDVGGEELKRCYQCGTCTAVCPWGNLEDFSPRRFIEMTRLGIEGFEGFSWTCANCRLCRDNCPQEIDIPGIFQAVRRVLLEWGSNPSELNLAIASLRSDGNPWGEPAQKKTAWAEKLAVPGLAPDHDHVLFACCTNELDPRGQKSAAATAAVLTRAGVSFGYLGDRGTCCGDQVHSVGQNALSGKLERKNVEAFRDLGGRTLVTLSPHCLHAFRNRFPGDLPVRTVHVTELLADLVAGGRLTPVKPVELKATYHDPCYLGRYNEVYDAPRAVLAAIPGLQITEMAHSREESLCCGGGGGGAWMDRPKGKRLGDLRVLEALAVAADTIVTACPFCVQMLEASILGMSMDQVLRVRTVSEVLLESLA